MWLVVSIVFPHDPIRPSDNFVNIFVYHFIEHLLKIKCVNLNITNNIQCSDTVSSNLTNKHVFDDIFGQIVLYLRLSENTKCYKQICIIMPRLFQVDNGFLYPDR